MKTIFTMLVACLLVGCATTTTSGGKRLEQSAIDQLKTGSTTKAEMYASFGQPTTVSASADGTTTALWTHHVINSMAYYSGDDPIKSQMLSAAFDANDVLVKFSLTDKVNEPKP